jgi:hypothetical protein
MGMLLSGEMSKFGGRDYSMNKYFILLLFITASFYSIAQTAKSKENYENCKYVVYSINGKLIENYIDISVELGDSTSAPFVAFNNANGDVNVLPSTLGQKIVLKIFYMNHYYFIRDLDKDFFTNRNGLFFISIKLLRKRTIFTISNNELSVSGNCEN